MTRSSSVLAVLALAFVGIAFVAPPLRVSTPRGLPDKLDRAEPPSDAGAVVMGVLAGVMVSLPSAPGTPGTRKQLGNQRPA